MLQAEAREYGDDWLRNRIKVHINITNRPTLPSGAAAWCRVSLDIPMT
jgi:hypothetical protein